MVLALVHVIPNQVPSINSSSRSSNPFHDPYYLHPNESLGTVLVNTTLKGGNYHLWVHANVHGAQIQKQTLVH